MRRRAGWWVAPMLVLGCGDQSPVTAAHDAALDAGLALDGAALRDTASEAAMGVDVPQDQGPADVGAPDTGPRFEPYPEGPYGNVVGAVLANLSWEGYVNPSGEAVSNTLPYGPTSLDELRRGGRYALVHVSEFY
ncbi:MAG: hypothetical protein JNK72_25425 [Myxococcales bacterium]|nr:hypothetical protein [Myxococcales bacterium]